MSAIIFLGKTKTYLYLICQKVLHDFQKILQLLVNCYYTDSKSYEKFTSRFSYLTLQMKNKNNGIVFQF